MSVLAGRAGDTDTCLRARRHAGTFPDAPPPLPLSTPSDGAKMGIKGAFFRSGSIHPADRRMFSAGLTGLINDFAPKAIKQAEMKTLFGRKVAIDACVRSHWQRRTAR